MFLDLMDDAPPGVAEKKDEAARSNLDPVPSSETPRDHRPTWMVSVLFAVMMAVQTLGFLILGTGRFGQGLSEIMLVLQSVIAITCAIVAFRRARGIASLFWSLYTITLIILLIPTAFQAYDTLLNRNVLPDSTRGLLYCLYGAPVLMMLFLPETYRHARLRSEVFLDLFQIFIVVGLIYSTFFFLPVRSMLPADALMHSISISDAQDLLLLIAVLVRLQLARVAGTRRLLSLLSLFLLVCAITTFVGDWTYLHISPHYSAWFDLGWAIPQLAASLLAVRWKPLPETESAPQAAFLDFVGSNLVLVAMLSCAGLLLNYWKRAYGETVSNIAISAFLVAFTLRLALTQFHQQQEIVQRKKAQQQLTASHQQIGSLLEDARRQTSEITQISELGSLLQACSSRQEIFRLIPDRMRRLFPTVSGSISLFVESRNRLETVVNWGVSSASQIFSPDECWALRRGCVHAHARGSSAARCAHLIGEGASVCIPLIASGEAVGTFSIQDNEFSAPPTTPLDADAEADAFARRRQLAAAVAEHIALAVANLNLRESLRLQAVRDPLTQLYNRRYMQEFLDRELHSARRKHRPLAVMMLDIDHFKRYNDNHGHTAGDRALAAVGETLTRCVRAEDVACRYGGEEFALILPECSLAQATIRAEEIRERLKDLRPKHSQTVTEPLTVSIGVAAFDETTDRVDLLLKFADDALYQAKRNGRNRVVAARPASPPDLVEGESASAASAS